MTQAVQARTGRGYSTRYEDHQQLLHMLSRKTFGILQSNGVSAVDYDDVFQEATMSYLRAKEGYKPELGFTFTAYMGRSVNTNLTRFAGRYLDEKAKLGLASLDAEDEDGMSLDEIIGDSAESVEDHLVRGEEMTAAAESLSPDARRLLVRLLRSCTMPDNLMDDRSGFRIVQDALNDLDLPRSMRGRVLDELFAAYKVSKNRPKKVSKNCIYDDDQS